MYAIANRNRVLGLAATTAMAAAMLTGCTAKSAPAADFSASKAEAALAKGEHMQAIENAEAAVLAEPRNPAYRVVLGSAYLDAGRFTSAATSFDDAMKLGDESPSTALRLALALAGSGQRQQALELLVDWEGAIATADLGLAYALAGQPERGIHLMSNAIRAGDSTPKIRQNLAYSYALAGRWREARLMAAQDVPAGEVGNRMEQWAVMAQPEAWHHRVAALLDVPAAVADAGQPVQLALANNPSIEQLAAEASPPAASADISAPALAANGELSPLAAIDPTAESFTASNGATSDNFEAAFTEAQPKRSAVASVTHDSARFVQQPVVQSLPARSRPTVAAARPVASRQSDGTHLVQLGSFSSEQGARKAWDIYVKRYPDLADHQMVISEAVVRGKHYWRVSAGGFGASASQAMCGKVKSRGQGCFAYAEGRPLPGAVDTGTRMAMR